ncbi:hypothetical protein GH714_037200 [Hevea brasiliensis]|uniref:Major facilitator superfamily (MFS) profile domain-containing protein n=1 Tax=Hevea brasiliensis TaxID=3981 RepID=A0A6A6MME6_HEVBR|nr:hypothetical protein GH714_037200 [Hevea brasiliensis]
MGIKEDIENGNDNANNGVHKEMREPLIGKNLADEEDGSREQNSNKQREWMVYFTTLVAVCGSFEFGCCHSIVGSILTFGAMIGAITSGPIADFIGRKRAKMGREKHFEIALKTLRGKDMDISHDADEIKIGVGMMAFQQIGGINGVCFYLSNNFESAGFSASVGTIASAIIQANELALNTAAILAVIGTLIFPINIKGVGASLATLMNWFGAWTISYTYNFLMSWSSYGTFVLYAVVNALGILFVTKVVPETKGRTLEQIQAAIMHIETEQRSKDHHPLEINAIT